MPARLIMKTTIESSGRMPSPAHPGEILREMYMVPLGVTVTKVADALGVTRKHVSAIVNGRAPITPDMAAGGSGGVGARRGCVGQCPAIGRTRARSVRAATRGGS